MNQRQSTASKLIFYRGISLKEYLKKTSQYGPSLQYKDDQTILLDQNHSPVLISDCFIHKEIEQKHRLPKKRQSLRVPTQLNQESQFQFPILKNKRSFQIKDKGSQTQRKSTDTSLREANDTPKVQLPILHSSAANTDQKELPNSRTSTQNSIFKVRKLYKRHCSQLSKDPKDKISKGRSLSNRKYVEMICNQVQQKSLGGKLINKLKYVEK